MKYDALVFDLDGTLWNSCPAVALGWTAGLNELGFSRTLNANNIASICGLPTPDCIRKLCPEITEEHLEQAMEVLGKHEKEFILKLGGKIYPDVLDGLKELKRKYRLFLVSNCQEWYLKCFFDLHDVSELFVDWECYGRTRKSKGENLKALALRNDIHRAIYIGDTESDFTASQIAGYDFGFVSYGFGKVETDKNYSNFSKLVEAFV